MGLVVRVGQLQREPALNAHAKLVGIHIVLVVVKSQIVVVSARQSIAVSSVGKMQKGAVVLYGVPWVNVKIVSTMMMPYTYAPRNTVPRDLSATKPVSRFRPQARFSKIGFTGNVPFAHS